MLLLDSLERFFLLLKLPLGRPGRFVADSGAILLGGEDLRFQPVQKRLSVLRLLLQLL